MNADTYCVGTKAHKNLQDYARASRIFGAAYVIVSDGCSSSPDTDIGARFMTLAAANGLANVVVGNEICKEGDSPGPPRVLSPHDVLEKAERMVHPPLLPTCLDATLLVAYELPEGVAVDVAGDGVVVGRRRDGTCLVYDFDCAGAPSYLSYLRDKERLAAYLKEYGQRTIRASKLAGDWGQPSTDQVTLSLISQHTESPFTGMADYAGEAKPFYHCFFSKQDFDLVMLVTDGVKSFQKEEAVPMERVLLGLLDFKSYTGEFVTRRVRKFLTKECVDLGWVNNDDLGVGAIHF